MADIKRLAECGYHTVESLTMTPKKNLLIIKGISEAKVDKLLIEGRNIYRKPLTFTYFVMRKRVIDIECKAFDCDSIF